jgi:hypothetical protein
VTGVKRDLFKLEDSLAAELQHVLPGAEQPDMSFTVTPVQSDGMNTQPQVVYQAPDNSGSNPAVYDPGPLFDSGYYNNGFDYAGYDGFGYPFIYGGFLGVGGRDHRGGYGNGGYHNRTIGGGPIVNSPRGTITPSHGFVGSAGTAEGHAGMGGFGGGAHR